MKDQEPVCPSPLPSPRGRGRSVACLAAIAWLLAMPAPGAQLWITNSGPRPDTAKEFTSKINTNFQFLFTNALTTTNGRVTDYYLKTDGTNDYWAEVAAGAGSGEVTYAQLAGSNYVTQARLAGSNYVSRTELNGSNYIAGVSATFGVLASDILYAPETITLTNVSLMSTSRVAWGSIVMLTNEFAPAAALSVKATDNSDYGSLLALTLQGWTTTNRMFHVDGPLGYAALAADKYFAWASLGYEAAGAKDLALHRAGAGTLMVSATTNAVPTGTLHASNGYFRGALTGETFTATSATVGDVSNTELQFLNGVSSAIQTQLDNKQALDSDLTALAGISGVEGDIIYRNGSQWTRLAKGTAGQVLEMNAGATAPEWDTDDSGGAGSQTPLAQDVDGAGKMITNLFRINLNKGAITATATNLTGNIPGLLMLGHSTWTFTPTNTAMVDLISPTGTDWVWPPKLGSVVVTGATAGLVHSLSFSNAVAVNTLVLLPGTTNWFEVWYDGITNRVRSLQELTTGSGAVVLSNAPTILNATLTTPTIADFSNATHSHENAASGGTLSGAAIASGTVADARIASTITRDTEWDTIAEIETAIGGGNILLETEIDASAELRALMDDESGTGALLFAGGDVGAGTATTPAGNDNDTSVATTAYVQTELADYVLTTAIDTIAEIEAIAASVNILVETEIDASSELRALMDDESGTGALLFAGGDVGAATATSPSAGDNDTSVATTAFVQNTITNYLDYVWIPAGAMTPAAVNGATTNTFAPSGADGATVDVFDFDDTTEETNFWTWRPPENWDAGTLKVKVHWTATTGTAGSTGVTWAMRVGALSDDDAFGAVLGTQFASPGDTYIASGDMHITGATSAITAGGTPAVGDMLLFQIVRKVADVSDTKTGDAKLIGVMVEYTRKTLKVSGW